MTATDTAPAATASAAGPAAGPRARFRDLVAAQWLALWSLRSTAWTLGPGALAVAGINANGAYQDYRWWDTRSAAGREAFREFGALRDAFSPSAAMTVVLVLSAFGAMATASDHHTGMIRTTLTAVPARRSLMAAKALVVAGVTTVWGAVVAAVSFGVTQAILSGRDAAAGLGDPGAVRIVVVSALLAPLSALVGLGLGAIVRHGAGAVVACVFALLMLPLVIDDDRYWPAVLDHTLPYSAWQRLTEIADFGTRPHPWTTTGAWIVYAVWAAGGALATVLAVHRRDL